MRKKGLVKWFSNIKGYGFIQLEGSDEANVFVHYSAVDMDGYKTLEEGDRVRFDLVDVGKGPQAQKVRILREWDALPIR